ncbi:mas-related G-protein coupled receptor member X2-like [Callospermophilus lateralis]|uniref:mas-related G-protein coupled receptor member X2-like n=1 Tax=Callospermophilus lateralis TaxID=76772 RepID=UPI0040544E15
MVNGSNWTFPQPVNFWTSIGGLPTLIIAQIGLVGNAVVLWLLGFRMHRNALSVYILNLAGADFLFLCFHVIVSLNKLNLTFLSFLAFILKHLPIVMTCSYLTGLSVLSAISAERCLSILCPIWYCCHRPIHMSAVICAILWALSLLLSILDVYHCSFLSTNFNYWCQTFSFITAAWLIILFMVLSISSLTLLIRILCGSRRVPLTRLYVTIGLIVLVFLFCGLPIGILRFLSLWIHNNDAILHFFKRIALFLSCINSSAKPIIYIFVGSCRRGQNLWRQQPSLKLVLEKAFQDIPEVKKSGESLPQETTESTVVL